MKSKKLLNSFTKYCEKYPDLRFWQALVNWCGNDLYMETYIDQYQKIVENVFYRTKK